MNTPYEPSQTTIDAVTSLIDEVVRSHSNGEETFEECLVCGEWEGHSDTCFVPAINKWRNS